MPRDLKSKKRQLTHLLRKTSFPSEKKKSAEKEIKELQLKMLRIQQGLWHSKRRAIILFEGFDAAGKGGAIRHMTESLDPRGFRVHPIGPPTPEEQGRHYLYRFWRDLPLPGSVAVFDRSWYGRVLVERVEKLTSENRCREAFEEINQFEAMLQRDGIDLVKIFLAIHPDEQLKRFEDRLNDPYKQWKLTDDDLEARRKWDQYVEACDEVFSLTGPASSPWHLIPADSKDYARNEVLKTVTNCLSHHSLWMENLAQNRKYEQLRQMLKKLKRIK